MIRQEATKQLGTSYSLLGDVTTSVIHATILDQAGRVAALIVKLDATYVYEITPGEKRHLIRQIAGKTKPQALAMLFQQPGIQAASVNSNAATLPEDPGRITIVVVYRSASV